MSEDTKIRQETFLQEQCILLENYQTLLYKTGTSEKSYKNFHIMEGDPSDVVHRISTKLGVESLMSLTPAQKALLVPRIELYKIKYKSEKDKVGIEKKFFFRDHVSSVDIENIVRGKQSRGDDVGITSFSYKLEGKNPADSGIVSCEISFLFQNPATLLKDMPEEQANYRDLIIPEKLYIDKIDAAARKWNSKYFRIKAIVGWAIPPNVDETLISKDLRKAISKSSLILFLTFRRHSINFSQDGTMELKIEFQGAIEGVFKDERSDIFLIEKNGTLLAEKKQLEEHRQDLNKTISEIREDSELEQQTKNDLREKLKEVDLRDKQIKYASLINALYEQGMMYYVDVDDIFVDVASASSQKKIEELQKESQKFGTKLTEQEKLIGTKGIFEQRRKKLKGHSLNPVRIGKKDKHLIDTLKRTKEYIDKGFNKISDANLNKEQYKHNVVSTDVSKKEKKFLDNIYYTKPSPGKLRINYLYLGDILDIVFGVLTDISRDDVNNLNILVGPIAFMDPFNVKNENPREINLADIPISLNLFLTWYINNVVEKQLSNYPLQNFLENLITTMIIPALGEDCFAGIGRQRTQVSVKHLTVPTRSSENIFDTLKKTRIQLKDLSQGLNEDVFPHEDSWKDIKNLSHIFYIYVSNWDAVKLTGDYSEDIKSGIYHFYLGADRGIVREINFTKEDQKYVGEMRVTAATQSSLVARDRYNATILMEGNSLFSTGQIIYIDARGVGIMPPTADKNTNLMANMLGLGGYYQIVSISSESSPSDYVTSIQARWISTGDVNANRTMTKRRLQNFVEKKNKQSESISKLSQGINIKI